MTKHIVVESPLDCPYHKTLEFRGEVTRRWCSYRWYDECFKDKFPKDCPLKDMPKAYDPEYLAEYIISRCGGDFVGNNKGYVIQEKDVVDEFNCDLMYEITAEMIPEVYRLIRRKQIKSGVRKLEGED